MSKELTPEQLEKRKATNKKILKYWSIPIVIVAITIAVLLVKLTDVGEIETDPYDEINWSTATVDEKKIWLQEDVNRDSRWELESQLKQIIAKDFNYPETVDYSLENSPNYSNGIISDPEIGLVVLNGLGTAENAFKQKEEFYYNCQLLVSPDTVIIREVNVSPR